MKRILSLSAVSLLVFTACGGTGSLFGDGGGTGDMAMVKLFQLKSGIYTVGAARIGNDACMVNPLDPMMGLVNKTFALTNAGAGVIKLGSVDMTTMNTAGPDTGTPPQPSNGSSCPGTNNPPECASDINAKAFNNNIGTLVRDNGVDDKAGCTYHRNLIHDLTITADNTFTSAYTRTDTMHVGNCTQKTDCVTTLSIDFTFTKAFGM